MTQQPSAAPETSKWPHTRQDFPITTPPVPGIHTASPSAPPSGWLTQNTTFPLGLASLTHLESIFIDSYVKPFEAVLGHNRKNKYVLMADKGEWLFDVQEDSSLCSRICWGNGREMEFKVFDRSRQEVLRFHHPFALVLGKLDVYAGSRRLGSVHHKWALYPKVEVRDDAGKPLFTIEGEACQCDCKSVKDFQVYSSDKSRQIGLITKQWLGIQRRLVSCGAFNVSFPVNLDVELKVLLIASAIHLDHAYFQRNVDVI